MDTRKSSIIGWILIFGVMVGFFFLNRPSAEKLAQQQRVAAIQDSLRQVEIEKAAAEAMAEQARYVEQMNDTTSALYGTAVGEEQLFTLRNSQLSIDISSKGAAIVGATLADYNDQQGQPLILFDKNDRKTAFLLDGKMENINTADRYFQPVSHTDSTLVLRLSTHNAGYLDFTYRLLPDNYTLFLTVQATGMQNFFSSQTNQMGIRISQRMRHQEKGYTFEQRYTYLSYRETGHNPGHITEASGFSSKSLSKTVEFPSIDWIAYKNQFFSTLMAAEQTFTNARLTSTLYRENEPNSTRYTDADTVPSFYIKFMESQMSTAFDPTGAQPSHFQFFIGPNQFKTLKAAGKLSSNGDNLQFDKLIYMGWPVVRLVNRYIIVPLFDFLTRWGMNMGIVLLLLTFIVKMVVLPFTRKQFMSSAKMRALKPHLDEIKAKYPDPADSMQMQQEQMQVYSKYGVSPMGGCLPMIIQMPVWMALFFFIPNAIELRQERFLWATDLSAYDDILSWPGRIPLFGDHISIFCLLFCVVNILNTVVSMKMQPTAGQDQSSQKMMKWTMYLMPVIFLFTLNGYSSGLNYYYFISSLMSIVIMFIMRRTTDDKKLLAELEANYKKNQQNPPKKSGMVARLEAMQQEQQRLQQEQQRRLNKKNP